jgi:biotin transporter BioY
VNKLAQLLGESAGYLAGFVVAPLYVVAAVILVHRRRKLGAWFV